MSRDEAVLLNLRAKAWPYASQDPEARRLLRERVEEAAGRRSLVTYSDLVRGIEFRLANVNGGRPFTIEDWTEQERGIIGDFLGMINAESYEESGLLLSALVVLKADGTPGPGFTKFVLDIGALRSRSEEIAFWANEVARAHTYYTRSRASTQS